MIWIHDNLVKTPKKKTQQAIQKGNKKKIPIYNQLQCGSILQSPTLNEKDWQQPINNIKQKTQTRPPMKTNNLIVKQHKDIINDP